MKKAIGFSLVILVIQSLGCATKGTQSVDAEQYVQGLRSESVRQSRSSGPQCPRTSESWSQESSWRALVAQANACVRSQNWPQVEAIGQHLAQTEPVGPWGAYYLSLSAEATQRLPRALWMIDLALKKAPRNSLLTYQMGRVQWAMGDYEKAMESYQQALRYDSDLMDAHLALGLIYFRDQDSAKANHHLSKVLESEPQNFAALVALGEIQLERGQREQAQELLARAARENSSDQKLRARLDKLNEELALERAQALAASSPRREPSAEGSEKGTP